MHVQRETNRKSDWFCAYTYLLEKKIQRNGITSREKTMMLCYNDDHDDTIIIGYYSTPLFLQMENGNSISADKKMIGLNNIFIRVLIFLERGERRIWWYVMAVISPQWAIESQILFCLRRHHCEAETHYAYLSFPFYVKKAKKETLFRDPARFFSRFTSILAFVPSCLFYSIWSPCHHCRLYTFSIKKKGFVIPFDDHYNNVKLEKRCTFKLYGAYSNIIEEKYKEKKGTRYSKKYRQRNERVYKFYWRTSRETGWFSIVSNLFRISFLIPLKIVTLFFPIFHFLPLYNVVIVICKERCRSFFYRDSGVIWYGSCSSGCKTFYYYVATSLLVQGEK